MFFILSFLLMFFNGEHQLSKQHCCLQETAITPSEAYKGNKLAFAVNNFALNLHNTFSNDENIFSSPLSIFIALGMLYAGARGSTAEEIRRTLSYDIAGLSDETINHDFQKLLLSYVDSSGEYKLEIANALISQDKYPILKEYKEILKNYYGAIAKEVDFNAKNEEALQEINNWVSNKTNGKIPQLLDKLDKDTLLALLNAVYFKGKWKAPFYPPLTEKGTFYNKGNTAATVQMMIQEGHFLYGDFPEYDAQAINMPYIGDRVSMIVLLPKQRNGVQALQRKLTANILKNIIDSLEDHNVVLKLPKFRLEDSQELKQNLKRLGMKLAFTRNANLGGIDRYANLRVSKIVHKALVNVNEVGTEATGATAVLASPRMLEETSYFTVEHPFLFFIIDNETGMILFYGCVNVL